MGEQGRGERAGNLESYRVRVVIPLPPGADAERALARLPAWVDEVVLWSGDATDRAMLRETSEAAAGELVIVLGSGESAEVDKLPALVRERLGEAAR
jgi:hypothetical protein